MFLLFSGIAYIFERRKAGHRAMTLSTGMFTCTKVAIGPYDIKNRALSKTSRKSICHGAMFASCVETMASKICCYDEPNGPLVLAKSDRSAPEVKLSAQHIISGAYRSTARVFTTMDLTRKINTSIFHPSGLTVLEKAC